MITLKKKTEGPVENTIKQFEKTLDALEEKLSKYNLEYEWSDDRTIEYSGDGFSGDVYFHDDEIEMVLELSLLASLFQDTIVSIIEEELDKIS